MGGLQSQYTSFQYSLVNILDLAYCIQVLYSVTQRLNKRFPRICIEQNTNLRRHIP